MYRDRFQSHRWTTTVYEGVEEQSGKKQSVTASRLPFVREEKGGGRRTSGWGEADKSWTGWTTKPFICLRFICVRAKGTRTRRLRLPTCRGTRHATNNDRPNKCKNPSSPLLFLPHFTIDNQRAVLYRTTTDSTSTGIEHSNARR